MWIRFKNGGYNHVWPNRATTFYPDGSAHNVKREVADGAIALDRGEKCSAPTENVDVAEGDDSK